MFLESFNRREIVNPLGNLTVEEPHFGESPTHDHLPIPTITTAVPATTTPSFIKKVTFEPVAPSAPQRSTLSIEVGSTTATASASSVTSTPSTSTSEAAVSENISSSSSSTSASSTSTIASSLPASQPATSSAPAATKAAPPPFLSTLPKTQEELDALHMVLGLPPGSLSYLLDTKKSSTPAEEEKKTPTSMVTTQHKSSHHKSDSENQDEKEKEKAKEAVSNARPPPSIEPAKSTSAPTPVQSTQPEVMKRADSLIQGIVIPQLDDKSNRRQSRDGGQEEEEKIEVVRSALPELGASPSITSSAMSTTSTVGISALTTSVGNLTNLNASLTSPLAMSSTSASYATPTLSPDSFYTIIPQIAAGTANLPNGLLQVNFHLPFALFYSSFDLLFLCSPTNYLYFLTQNDSSVFFEPGFGLDENVVVLYEDEPR